MSYLYQLAGKHRYASALMAARIEAMTREVASRSGGRLEAVSRESLVRYPEIYDREEPYLMAAEERPRHAPMPGSSKMRARSS